MYFDLNKCKIMIQERRDRNKLYVANIFAISKRGFNVMGYIPKYSQVLIKTSSLN